MGLGAFFSGLFGNGRPKTVPETKPEGTNGVVSFSGLVDSGETHGRLTGDAKWRAYTNAINRSTIATGVRYRGDLLAGIEWTAKPNEAGGKDADRGVEIIDQGLLKAQMPRPWAAVAAKQSLYKLTGFKLHEGIIRRRPDGMVVYASLEPRPEYTVQRWDIPDEQSPWQGVVQVSRSGTPYYVERARLFYSVDDLLGEGPDGVGLLRHLAEIVRRLDRVEELEILGYENGLRGMPILRAPIAQLKAQSGLTDVAGQSAFVAAQTADLRNIIKNQIKSPEKPTWAVIDSALYQSADKTLSSTRQWDLELLKSDGAGLPDAAKVVERLHLEAARLLGIEFALMGGSGSGGAYAMHEDKTSMLAAALDSVSTQLANDATQQLCRRLIALNGLDPDTACPTLVPGPIAMDDIVQVTQALVNMSLAGMDTRDPATDVLRQRLRLPDAPPPPPEAMGVIPRPSPPPAPASPSGSNSDAADIERDEENQRDGKAA